MADSVSAVLEGSAQELRAWKRTLLDSCVKWLIVSFSSGQLDHNSAQDEERQMLLRFNELLVGVSPFLREPDYTFKGKRGLGRPEFTDVLQELVGDEWGCVREAK